MSFLSRPFLMTACAVFCFSLAAPMPVWAVDAPAAPDAQQNAASPSGKFVQDLGERAVKIISNKQLSATQRNTEFAKVLNDSFDIKTIGRFVIGRTWNSATPDQQTEYMNLFQGLVIKNYGDRMTLAAGENFQVVGSRSESDNDMTVNSQITHSDGSKPTDIDWRVRQKDGKMAIIDVIVAGVSLSVTQRQEYSSIIQNNGGQIDGLLQTMRSQLNGA